QLGLDGAVVLGHDVPARLRLPGGTFNLLVEQVCAGAAWAAQTTLGQVSREARDAFREHPDSPVGDVDVGEDDGHSPLLPSRSCCTWRESTSQIAGQTRLPQ